MRKTALQIFVLFLLLSITGCNKDEESTPIYQKVAYSFNKPKAKYISFKDNISDLQLYTILPPTCLPDDSINNAPIGRFSIIVENYDIAIEGQKLNNADFSNDSILNKIWFGKEVTFKIKERYIMQNGDLGVKEQTKILYVPEIIQITTPKMETSKDLYPMYFYKDVLLRWNADPNNSNGVMITISWGGSILGQFENTDEHISTTCIVDDNGEILLDKNLFDDIPDYAFVYIKLLRGSYASLNLDNQFDIWSYWLSGETSVSLAIFLRRETK